MPVVVGIMGPDKQIEKVGPLAEQLGKAAAEAGWMVLTGGRSRGVMHAACTGAKSAGGTTIGIIPGDSTADISPAVDIPIVTGMGSARDNINALSSTVLVAVGMGPGTSAEVSLALKCNKHCILLGVGDEAASHFSALAPSLVHIAGDVGAAVTHIKSVLPA
mmetsp:Transcript_7562/g.20138  ORF Transcript_7562/g.20138 Transcript_7562/m.20138 type:complete len:162 (+) Transcript_7562:135-620(+)|eukprot:CAMPEP_0202351976 /NCGR_PEP_ID=MMETSP1126-20121109/8372_1 /ASSEMBLY_ACC=CAM_ASM_000457 /TAXON_ID=3047 /ORGANISM="Dunaliella tertiolecta, Strain CCMP1320" /LENGTH=161 /DNA_ID=CAMNT_0048944133 /DNA_START=82 /DNA_END=567 /DNA_ORIENTATION=+